MWITWAPGYDTIAGRGERVLCGNQINTLSPLPLSDNYMTMSNDHGVAFLSFKEEKRDVLSSKMHPSSFTSSNNFSLAGLSLENGWDQISREKPSVRESNQNFARTSRLKLLKKCYFLRAFSLLSGMIDFNLYFWNKAIMCPVFTVLVNNYYFSWSILWKQQGTQEMHKN